MEIKYELNLTDYWLVIRRRQWVILAVFLAVFIGSIIFTNMQTPLYKAIAGVRIIEHVPVASMQPAYYQSYQTDRMASQEKVITSQAVLEKAARKLGMIAADVSSDKISDACSELQGMIETEREGSTDLIRIVVTSDNPELAAKVANAVAESFQEVDLTERKKQASTLRQFVEEQLALSAKRLHETEDSLKNFQESGKATGLASILQNQLATLENKKLELLKSYTEKYPDVVRTQEQITALKERISLLPESELNLSRLQREVEVTEKTYRAMKEKYEESRISEAEEIGDVRIVDYASVPKSPFSPNKMINKLVGAFIGLVIGIFAAFMLESVDTSLGTIEALENVVKVPVLGIVPYLPKGGAEQPWWWRPLAPLLVYFNRFKKGEEIDLHNLIIQEGGASVMAEAFRVLRTYITLETPKTGSEVLLITSAGPREGKTLICANLAISIAQTGAHVLLVDSDFRRSVVHKLFGLSRQPGLSDLIMGKVKPEEAIRSLFDILTGNMDWDSALQTKGLDHLHILTAGTKVAMASELLEQDKLVPLLDYFKSHYDFVILDSPPVMPVSDAIVLGRLANRVIFVYQAGKTDKRMLVRTIDECKMAGLNVSGIVLNYATAGVQLSSPTYYKGRYRYYSDEGEAKQ